MIISNIRMGFATNSSSCHSIIFGLKNPGDDYCKGEFGWDEFCLSSKNNKNDYLAQTLFDNIKIDIGDEMAMAVVKDWANKYPTKSGYVDHQSLMSLPVDVRTGKFSKEFFKDLRQYYLQDNLSIVGGNDNDDFRKFSWDVRNSHVIKTECVGTQVCRKDGKWWTIFNQKTGAKIRLSFADNPGVYKKSSLPELIDCKITDKCAYRCAFCYMGSTPKGQHADIKDIESFIWSARDMGVFEVALGGGDPILHPDFVDIIECFHSNGVIPNFTTRDTSWIKNPKTLESVKKCVGKFAISIDSSYDKSIERSYYLASEFGIKDKISFQYIMGITSLQEFEQILDSVNNIRKSITLLGFKNKNRGKTFKLKKYDGWLDIIRKDKYKNLRVGIDTCLAQKHKKEIHEDGISDKLVAYEEGKFSMFVDCVNKKVGASSFCDDSQLINIDNFWRIGEIYKKF